MIIVHRHRVKTRFGGTYKIEVWKGYQGYTADVLPMGSNEPICTRYAMTEAKAYALARNWLERAR